MPDPRPDNTDSALVARLLRIRGRVQGVGYRAAALDEAMLLGLAGWVRNRRDGSVEVLAVGSEAAIERFIDWARQGPPAAAVERVEISATDLPEMQGGGFAMRPTE